MPDVAGVGSVVTGSSARRMRSSQGFRTIDASPGASGGSALTPHTAQIGETSSPSMPSHRLLMATVSPLLQRFEHPASILHQGLHSVRWGVSVFSAQSWIRPYVSSVAVSDRLDFTIATTMTTPIATMIINLNLAVRRTPSTASAALSTTSRPVCTDASADCNTRHVVSSSVNWWRETP